MHIQVVRSFIKFIFQIPATKFLCDESLLQIRIVWLTQAVTAMITELKSGIIIKPFPAADLSCDLHCSAGVYLSEPGGTLNTANVPLEVARHCKQFLPKDILSGLIV